MRKQVKTYPDRSGLSDQDALDMLDKLRTHYNQPVIPLGRVCNAIYDWAEALRDLAKRTKADGRTQHQGSAYLDHLSHITMDINKSGLLFRLLYLGDELRTDMCPTHNGHMNISMWCGNPAAGNCECDGTGWLPNKAQP